MRILHVIQSAEATGGGPIEGIQQLAAVSMQAGHQVEVATLDSPGSPHLASFPIPVHACGPGMGSYRYKSGFVEWLVENTPLYDIVIVNGLWGYHGYATWRAMRITGRPYVVFTHGMLDPWFKKTYPLKHLKKWLYWPWAEYRVLRDARAVLFTCQEECILARESFWLYQCREAVVNYGTAGPKGDGANQQRMFFERFPHLRAKKIILFMGRIHPKKGCDLAIEAFAEVFGQQDDMHLVLAGPDQVSWQEPLSDLAKRLQIASRVTWTGMLSGDLKWGAMRSADAFLLPSHQENFGIVVAEALACGTPVLISDQVNIWREIVQAGAGFVAPDTLEGTHELLRCWASATDDDKTRMRRRAVVCFARNFEVKRAAESLWKVLTANLVAEQPNGHHSN